MAYYIALLAVSAVLLTFGLGQILLLRLDARVSADLRQEVLELDQLLADGRDPATGGRSPPSRRSSTSTSPATSRATRRRFLAFVDGELHRSSTSPVPARRLPAERPGRVGGPPSRLPGDERAPPARFDTRLGEAHFRVSGSGSTDEPGAFVVAILPAEELEEIGDFLIFGVAATLGVLLVASAFAWLIAGRALEPVRS